MVAGRQPLPEGTVGLRTGCTTCPPYTWTAARFLGGPGGAVRLRHGRRLPSHRLPDLGETFTLAIGGQTEDGSYVYAALEAPAPGCDLFLISADKARTLSDLNYESLSADEEAE